MQNIIGNTPMIKIKYKYLGREKYIYSKLEWYNLTGSIKDRIVNYIINKSINNGILKNNQILVEATSGNTGISLAAIGNLYKHKVVIFMPDFVSSERQKIMKSYGAELHLVSKDEGGFIKCLSLAKDYALSHEAFLLNQFSNLDNSICHYETTANEIIKQIPSIEGFISGVGSGGTLMGIAKRLKEYNKNIIIGLLEPKSSPIISNNIIGNHKIEGIGDDFIPDLIDKSLINKVILIDSDDAINMSRKLSLEIGLGVGISSGANMLASIMLNEITSNVVTIFPDDNKKYLSTDLIKEIDYNENYISNKIELIGYEII